VLIGCWFHHRSTICGITSRGLKQYHRRTCCCGNMIKYVAMLGLPSTSSSSSSFESLWPITGYDHYPTTEAGSWHVFQILFVSFQWCCNGSGSYIWHAEREARARARKLKGMEEDDEVSEEVVMQFKEENQQENK